MGGLELVWQLHSYQDPRLLLCFCFGLFSMVHLQGHKMAAGASSHHHSRQNRFRKKDKTRGKGDSSQLNEPLWRLAFTHYQPRLSFKQSWGCSLLAGHNNDPNKIQGRWGDYSVDIHGIFMGKSTVVKTLKYLHSEDKMFPSPSMALNDLPSGSGPSSSSSWPRNRRVSAWPNREPPECPSALGRHLL